MLTVWKLTLISCHHAQRTTETHKTWHLCLCYCKWFLSNTWIVHTNEETNTHTHTFNGSLLRTTQVSRYQKGKTNLVFTEARDSEWQWHLLGHIQVCISIQTDNHASTHHLVFYRPDALPATQLTASKYWRQIKKTSWKQITIFL